MCYKAKIGLNFCPLLQGGLGAISAALPCPDRSPLPSPPPPQPAHPLLLLSPDHNRQILQHLLPREISTESFTHLLFLLCPLSSSLFPTALFSLSLSFFPPFHCLCLSLNYSFAAAGTEPEWRKLSHQRRFTSSTSTTATWVTLWSLTAW